MIAWKNTRSLYILFLWTLSEGIRVGNYMPCIASVPEERRYLDVRLRQALADKFQRESERVEKARAEFNFRSIEGKISRGSRVLDVGAWSCYLGQLLRDRMDCEVLSLDVVDVNKTGMPFQVFDGRRLPVDSGSFDVVLLLYVLHHAADDQPLLLEANRVLRQHGCLLVAEDSVDSLWNRVLTVGFHGWLWLITRMSCDGTFRTVDQWRERFGGARLEVKSTIPLGHHCGRFLWPRNILFVLAKNLRAASSKVSVATGDSGPVIWQAPS
jgi:SAM-dependent methyltransferase